MLAFATTPAAKQTGKPSNFFLAWGVFLVIMAVAYVVLAKTLTGTTQTVVVAVAVTIPYIVALVASAAYRRKHALVRLGGQSFPLATIWMAWFIWNAVLGAAESSAGIELTGSSSLALITVGIVAVAPLIATGIYLRRTGN